MTDEAQMDDGVGFVPVRRQRPGGRHIVDMRADPQTQVDLRDAPACDFNVARRADEAGEPAN